MKKALFALVIFLFLALLGLLGLYQYLFSPESQEREVHTTTGTVSMQELVYGSLVSFGSTTVSVEVVDTPETRAQGLSGRRELPYGTGMLFVFAEPDRYGFWMKDMYLALDMIWLDSAGRVVDITHNALPESYPQVFMPKIPVSYVLEVPAAFAVAEDIMIGDTADLSL